MRLVLALLVGVVSWATPGVQATEMILLLKHKTGSGGPPTLVSATPVTATFPAGATGDSGSTSITVPSGTTFAICTVLSYESVLNTLSGSPVTLGGTTMTAVSGGDNAAYFQGALFWQNAPTSGAQTLAWDWVGTDGLEENGLWTCVFYQGTHATTPVRSSSCTLGTNPHVTASLTAQTGDTAVGIAWVYAPAGATWTWNTGGANLTMTEQYDAYTPSGVNSDHAWADATPSGNGTISATPSSGGTDGGICGIVLRAP